MAAMSNTDFAKTLNMPIEWQAKAAAFADAKGLSLAAREVVAEYREGWVGRDGKKREPSLVLIVTADALMAIALRDGGRSFAAISTEFTSDGREWVQAWLDTMPPAACRVTFEVVGIDASVVVVHTWAEYVQGKASPTQTKMPAMMLAKATRSMGVRQIAPGAVGGLHSEEEAHAIDAAADAETQEVREIVEAVTPEVDKESAGTKLTRGEQHAARMQELVTVGKALRAECGDASATRLAEAIAARGCDPKAMSAADLKALLGVAKRAREDFERAAAEAAKAAAAPAPAAEPEAAPADALDAAFEAAVSEDEQLQAVAAAFDGEFVI